MTQSTHIVSALVALQLCPSSDPWAALACVAGTLLPDIDHPRRCGLVPLGMRVLGIRHRGMTHSLLALAIFALAGQLAGLALGAAHLGSYLGLGYGLHLVLDALNPSKVPLLWPNRRRWGIGLIRTGSLAEMLLLCGLVILYMALR